MDRDTRDETPEDEWLQRQEEDARRRRAHLVPEDDPTRPRRRPRQRSGMTWGALALLIVMLTFLGAEAWERLEPRFPPSGAAEQRAVVEDVEGLGDSATGSGPRMNVLVLRLDDGSTARVRYQARFLGEVQPGDTVTAYREDGEWRTTEQYSWGGVAGYGLGCAAFLLMLWGWFRVRRRDAEPPAEPGPGFPRERLRDV